MYCLLEAVSVYPEKLATKFVDKTEWIKVYPVHVYFFLILYILNFGLMMSPSYQYFGGLFCLEVILKLSSLNTYWEACRSMYCSDPFR